MLRLITFKFTSKFIPIDFNPHHCCTIFCPVGLGYPGLNCLCKCHPELGAVPISGDGYNLSLRISDEFSFLCIGMSAWLLVIWNPYDIVSVIVKLYSMDSSRHVASDISVYKAERYLAQRLDILMCQKEATDNVAHMKHIWNYKGNINVQVYACV